MFVAFAAIDCDVVRRSTRSGRSVTQIVLLPDADRSDPENDSDSDSGSLQTDCGDDDSSGSESLTEECVSDDDLPLSTRAKKKFVKRPSAADVCIKRNMNFSWVKTARSAATAIGCTAVFSDPPSDHLQPINYFKKFFTADVIAYITHQTNLYAAQSGSTFITNEEEIEQYLGILMKMGIVQMPRYQMYWSTELRYPPVAEHHGHPESR